MLLKSKIAKFAPHSKEWFDARIGMLTGSKVGVFCHAKGLGDTALTYIRRKVIERIEKRCFDTPIANFSTEWGRDQEPHALKAFRKWLEKKLGKDIIFIRPSVIQFDELFACTPDACVITNHKLITDANDTGYYVEPVEAKCLQVDGHLKLLRCITPHHLKEAYPDYFYQTVSQIEFTGALKGYFIAYNPEFTDWRRLHVIEFRKIDMLDDFKFFNTRKEEARILYNKEYDYYSNKAA